MASPPIPPLLDHLANRPFSFYPPIVNLKHNQWFFRRATWTELQVVNRRSGEEIWIPRRYVGEASRIEDPVMIVGLYRELELRDGMVVPSQRRIIEMPIVAAARRPEGRDAPAPVVGIRLERRNRRALKFTLIAAAALATVSAVVIGLKWV